MGHIANKHNHPDPLFPKCAHGDLEPRKWIKVGMKLFVYVYCVHGDQYN
jgi:hypothetical protein